MHRCGLLILLFLLAVSTPVSAYDGKAIVIEGFHADIVVNANASIEVEETIRLRFIGSWNGIVRSIPVEYRTPQGFNYGLFLDMESITDEDGNDLRYKSSRRRHYREFKIWIPGASDARRTVILHYRVENGLKFFAEHDELYWNITGDEWEMPIEFASASIVLPEGAAGLRAVAFTGGYGSREQAAAVQIEKNTVTLQTLRLLSFRQGLTAAVGWDPGVVRRPGALATAGLFLRSNWIFIIPLFALAAMFALWHSRGRDPQLRPIVPRYEPPEEMTPAEVGTLVDNVPNMRDITATIVDLAVRGYLVIEEREEEGFLGLGSKTEYTFTLSKKEPEWGELQPHERELLRGMFLGDVRHSVTLSELENSFYKYLPAIRDHIYERLIACHYYFKRPDKIQSAYGVCALIIGGAVGGFAFFLREAAGGLGVTPVSGVAAGVLSAAIIGGFGWLMPARTHRGARALEGVLGFEEFLGRVEADRLERLVKSPEVFEKYLPFAMALGVEKNWARAFADIYREPPKWYRGSGFTGFNTGSFVSNMSRMSNQTAAAMASSPRSSGGSGFGGGGGGGFSGGGFGGGGGRGF